MPNFTFSRYGIDPHTGFLSPEPPLRRLSGEYEQWEILLDQAKNNFVHTGPSPEITLKQRAFGCMWRKRVRKVHVLAIRLTPNGISHHVLMFAFLLKMRVLDCSNISDDTRKVQRAHHTLSFLTQFFVHSLPPRDPSKATDPIVIPASIAIPFVDVSRQLGIAPIVTYADTVLWNWDIIDHNLPLSRSNIRIRDLFTGSPQEEHFFLTSARIEIEGWNALDAIRQSLTEAAAPNPRIEIVAYHLRRLARSLDIITEILLAVRDGLDPDFFYNRFRPVSAPGNFTSDCD